MLNLDSVTLIGIDGVSLPRMFRAADICCHYARFAAVKILSSLPFDDPRLVPVRPITSADAYSDFIIHDLFNYVDTEHMMLIQHDGFILNPDVWTDEFLDYDFIGAPWRWDHTFAYNGISFNAGNHVGNGGFSIRTRRVLKIMNTELPHIKEGECEDIMLSVTFRPRMVECGVRFAPVDLAARFSYEAWGSMDGWNGQFGYHGRETDISRWKDAHLFPKV